MQTSKPDDRTTPAPRYEAPTEPTKAVAKPRLRTGVRAGIDGTHNL